MDISTVSHPSFFIHPLVPSLLPIWLPLAYVPMPMSMICTSVCSLCNEAQIEYREGTFARIGEPTGD